MVAKTNHLTEIMLKQATEEEKMERIRGLVERGFISPGLGGYAILLTELNHLAEQAELFSIIGSVEGAKETFGLMRTLLEELYVPFATNPDAFKARLEQCRKQCGCIVEYLNPREHLREDKIELYNHAFKIYDDAVHKSSLLLVSRY